MYIFGCWLVLFATVEEEIEYDEQLMIKTYHNEKFRDVHYSRYAVHFYLQLASVA